MAISITGGCDKCGRVMSTGYDGVALDSNQDYPDPDKGMVCYNCYNKHYSPAAVREKRLKKLLNPHPKWMFWKRW